MAKSPSLGSLTQTNAALYALYASYSTTDFHDITSGSNGRYVAGHGYDAVTGLGSPIVSSLVNDLVNNTSASFSVAKAASSTSIAGSAARLWWTPEFSVGNPYRPLAMASGDFSLSWGEADLAAVATGAASNGSPAAPAVVGVGSLPMTKLSAAERFGQPHLADDGLPVTDSPWQFDVPTALQSRVVDLIFANSAGRGVEDAAAIAMAASQPIFASPNPASNTPQTADGQMSRHGRIDQQGSARRPSRGHGMRPPWCSAGRCGRIRPGSTPIAVRPAVGESDARSATRTTSATREAVPNRFTMTVPIGVGLPITATGRAGGDVETVAIPLISPTTFLPRVETGRALSRCTGRRERSNDCGKMYVEGRPGGGRRGRDGVDSQCVRARPEWPLPGRSYVLLPRRLLPQADAVPAVFRK